MTAAAAISPGDNVASTYQAGSSHLILVIGNKTVIDAEIINNGRSTRIELLGINIVTATAIMGTMVFPGNDETTIFCC